MTRPALRAAFAGLASLATLGIAAPALGQQAQITVAGSAYGAQRQIDLELNKSMIIDLPAGVAEVIVSQPSVAAAIMRTRTRAILRCLRSLLATAGGCRRHQTGCAGASQ